MRHRVTEASVGTTLAVAWLGGAAVFLRVPHSHTHDHGAPGQEAVDLSRPRIGRFLL